MSQLCTNRYVNSLFRLGKDGLLFVQSCTSTGRIVATSNRAEIRLNQDCLLPVFRNFPIRTPLSVQIRADPHATRKKIDVITSKVSEKSSFVFV